jgi:hypothetical protein
LSKELRRELLGLERDTVGPEQLEVDLERRVRRRRWDDGLDGNARSSRGQVTLDRHRRLSGD